MSVSVKLNHTITTSRNGHTKLRLVVEADGISPKIFAIEILPRSADKLKPLYRFSHVCSPSEMVEFPDDIPGDNCYFRTEDIEMIFDTVALASAVLERVQHDIRILVNAYNEFSEESSTVSGSTTF